MLFHLHFNTPNVDTAAERLDSIGVPLRRQFGSVRGEGAALEPGESAPDGFRFKLQVHQRGAVNVTVAPGQRPRFDHFGLVVDDISTVFERSRAREWSVRENPRRSFVMTPWGFRVEVNDRDGEVAGELGDERDAAIESFTLHVPEGAPSAVTDVFGDVPALDLREDSGVRAEAFTLVGDSVSGEPVDVQELLAD